MRAALFLLGCAVACAQSDTCLIRTIAGSPTTYGGDGGPALEARLFRISGIAVDSTGALYIADTGNHRIRRVEADGTITTVAGTGIPGFSGDGGPASAAQLNFPGSLAFDSQGNLYVADTQNLRVRVVTPDGLISTFAGIGSAADTGDGGPARQAGFASVTAVAIGPQDNLLVLDRNSHRVRQISSGLISAFAGSGPGGGVQATGNGGPATQAQLAVPIAITADLAGNVYISDYGSIRRVGPDGIITAFAGYGYTLGDGGPALSVRMQPESLAADADGNLYLFDNSAAGAAIRMIDTTGTIRHVADIPRANIPSAIQGVTALVATDSGLFAATFDQVAAVAAEDSITLVAGSPDRGFAGDDGPALAAKLNLGGSDGIVVAPSGEIYFADGLNQRVRKIDPQGNIATIAGNGIRGHSGDGSAAVNASLATPAGLALDGAGNLYIADMMNNVIRRVSPDGRITTFAGSGAPANDGPYPRPADRASFLLPSQVAVDRRGTVYVLDHSFWINKISDNSVSGYLGSYRPPGALMAMAVDPSDNLLVAYLNGISATLAQITPDGQTSTLEWAAALRVPYSLAADASGNIYVNDVGAIRRYAPDGSSTPLIGLGTGVVHILQDGPAAQAPGSQIGGMALGPDGTLYFTDAFFNRVRAITAAGCAAGPPP